MGDAADDGVAPVHEGDFLVLGEGLGVFLLDEDVLGEHDLLLAEVGVLGVLVLLLGDDAFAGADDGDRHLRGVGDGRVAGGNGVDVLLVGGPERVPVKVHDVLGGSLLEDELTESGDGDTATADTTDGGHARVVPAPDEARIDDLGQLALGEERLHEVETGETPIVDTAELQCLDEPLVLRVAVVVLRGTECVGNALHGVDNGAAEVVRRVDLPLASCAVVILGIAAVDDGVTERLVRIVNAQLRPQTPLGTLLRASLHLREMLEVVLD